MMRIAPFTVLLLPLVTLMGCAGLPEKLPESAFDVPATDVPATDVPPPSDTLVDTAQCTDGDSQEGTAVCGLNDEGVLMQDCTDGAWGDNPTCTGTDVCTNGDGQEGATVCGLNNDSVYMQDCTDGTWVDNATCTDTFAVECGVIGNFVAIEAGGNHTCALTDKGTVWCWGDGKYGQLGNNLDEDANVPVQVLWNPGGAGQPEGPLDNISGIALGASFGCALDTDQEIVCWGLGDNGQMGDGMDNSNNAPESRVLWEKTGPDAVLTDVLSIAAGDQHACALIGTKIRCWGSNSKKQLSHGSISSSKVAIGVTLPNVQSIAAGGIHTCAVGDKNRTSCWGGNTFGQLGNDKGDSASTHKPDKVEYSNNMVDQWKDTPKGLTAGGQYTCAWLDVPNESGRLGSCWGTNLKGQLGYGGSIPKFTLAEKKVSFVDDESFAGTMVVDGILDMSAGTHHSCARQAIINDVITICWGDNESGQLGNGSSQSFVTSPVYVITSHSFTQIAAGGAHTCGLTDTGHVYCWGDNNEGQLGTGVFAGTVNSPGAAVFCPGG